MMRVGLMNLGDSPRVFHNKINRAVVVPVGRVVATDLDTQAIQALKFPARPETVLVCEPDALIPVEMEKIISLLTVIEFEEPGAILTKFHEIAPPNNMVGTIRPSRMQMRTVLRTMVEDYINEQVRAESGENPLIRDDVSPEKLQEELDNQREDNTPAPLHPLREEKNKRAELNATPARVVVNRAPPPDDSTSKVKPGTGGRRTPKAKKD